MHITGTPKELAQKLDISERQVFNCIEEIKSLGLPVFYSKEKQSYCYRYPVRLCIDITIENLSSKEKIRISGGDRLKHRLFFQY
jgi:biotin operon repressor